MIYCSNTKETRKDPREWIKNKCLNRCNITAIYQNQCGCPNDCYKSHNQGECQNNKCVCKEGYKGDDCSLISCPNVCSGNGRCIKTKNFDKCVCRGNYYNKKKTDSHHLIVPLELQS
jgi:hypothetical protein